MSVRYWSAEEENKLVAMILDGDDLEQIALELGRSSNAVEQRASRLGFLDRQRDLVRDLPRSWALSLDQGTELESFRGFLQRFLPGQTQFEWESATLLKVRIVTDEGDTGVLGVEEPTVPVTHIDTTDLFDRLRAWRKAKSVELKWAPYMLAWDSRLQSICQALPDTVNALARIPGLSKRLKTEYADEILGIVREWKASLAVDVQELIEQTDSEILQTEEIEDVQDKEFECAPVHRALLGMAPSNDFHWYSKHTDEVVRQHWKQYVVLWGALLLGNIEAQTPDERRVLDFGCVLKEGAKLAVAGTWERALLYLCQNIHNHFNKPTDEHRSKDWGEELFSRKMVGRTGPTARRYRK